LQFEEYFKDKSSPNEGDDFLLAIVKIVCRITKCTSCTNRQKITKKSRQGRNWGIKSYPQF
ncbi:MAG: hypothetical protein IJZ27_01155, partial [Treponema sp.]|nr:hypothetical protein [Treponema sp.]